ncbi:MAG: hypothetical protein WCD18_20730 [Thermosynechococcaceae cyanobacterium]
MSLNNPLEVELAAELAAETLNQAEASVAGFVDGAVAAILDQTPSPFVEQGQQLGLLIAQRAIASALQDPFMAKQIETAIGLGKRMRLMRPIWIV